jgi:SpoVK/Ycf46/Vps4 family AAA+-type ATPase
MAMPAHSSVVEAELYLQAVHTRTTQLSTEAQIRDLVTLAHKLIGTRQHTAQALWPKLDTVVNSLLQTSEHLQAQEAIVLAAKLERDKTATSCSAGTAVDTMRVSQQAVTRDGTSQSTVCDLEKQDITGGGGDGGGGNRGTASEEIGDIEWESSHKSDVNFKDVVGCTSAIDAIRESVVIPMQFPALFKRLNVKRSNGIMLYGPPGTGKSMIARATASEVNATFFNASCAELTSRWVGGSEKKLQSLFTAAVRNSPSIIFFDEVDSIACKREGDGSIADQRLTNQLLIELDKIFLAQSQVFVIAATNLPWQIDPAVMRRFPHCVYIELPDNDSRMCMFRSFFGPAICTDDNIRQLAQLSEHMSGSDIASIVNSILFEPIRILCRTTHFVVHMSTRKQAELTSEPAATAVPCFSASVDGHCENSDGHPSVHTTTIAVASKAQVLAFEEAKAAGGNTDDASPFVLERSLSELVDEYGEGCITMPPVEFENICNKVQTFRHTVSSDYLQQYVKFRNQRV